MLRVKAETKSFYQNAVLNAVMRIAQDLDQALDLTTLARTAALSPFHFHRVFRGMVGETPLELHRRLRMERAAFRLLTGEGSVTTIAFEAGYDTHEAFTRAFRGLYGMSPTAFRQSSPAAGKDCARPHSFELAARSGIHFRTQILVPNLIPLSAEGDTMEIDIAEMPKLRLGAVHHVGPYQHISQAFAKLGSIVGPLGLIGSGCQMIGVYHDEPETTPPEELHSDAAISVPEGVPLPEGLTEIILPKGLYARTTHKGPYTGLSDTWARFMGEWLPKSGHRMSEGMSYEIYLNTPENAQPHDLRTELYIPLSS